MNLDYGPPAGTPKAPRSMLQGGSPFITSFGRRVLTAKSRKRKCTSTYSNYLSIIVSSRVYAEVEISQLDYYTKHQKNILQQL